MPTPSQLIARFLPWVPRPLLRSVAMRYIAGTTRGELLVAVRNLHAAGLLTTVDVLGENVKHSTDLDEATQEYLQLLDALAQLGIPAQISVKPTILGLRMGEDTAAERLERVVGRAAERGVSVTLDMEDSSTTDATLRLFRSLRKRHEMVGLAIQAYLRRSVKDLEGLLALAPSVRICKGIYVEREAVAFQGRQEIRDSFLRLVEMLLEGGGFAEIATHDGWLIDESFKLLDRLGKGPASHEFQMLLGVGEPLRPAIRARGSALRLYCPYGPRWFGYSMRRLQENPKILTQVIKSYLRLEPFRYRRPW